MFGYRIKVLISTKIYLPFIIWRVILGSFLTHSRHFTIFGIQDLMAELDLTLK